MKKRLVSMLLALVMVLGMLPATALAASSEEDALGEVNIYNGEQKLSYLSINGRIRELIYTYFNYVDSNGRTKEIPAYCVNPNTKGVPQTVGPGESIKYIAKEKGSDPKVMGIIANGYPTRGLSELKLENKYHAYYATKMALWCYLLPNWNINNLKVNPNLTGKELQRAQAILAAAKDIYVRGTAWNKVYSPRVTATPDRDTAYAVTVDGQQYKQQVFTIHSDTWVCNYAIRVAFSDPASVPAGARIVDILATCRSYNIGLNIIVQNIQQIKALYEKEWESIIGNCDTLLFLGGGNEPTSLEFIVKLLGKETIATRTRGQTKGRSGSSSTNFQQTGRDLMTIDEVRKLDTHKAILFIRGEDPVLDKKYNIKRHPNIKLTTDGKAKPYIHKPQGAPDYALPDLPYAFRSLDDYEFIDMEDTEHESEQEESLETDGAE